VSQRGEDTKTGDWTEETSSHFIDYGDYFVPEREAQIAMICELVPPVEDGGTIVELCCGAGLLTRALLERFTTAKVQAFDGSETMLAETRRRAGDLDGRLETHPFDIHDGAWRGFSEPPRAVVSSLAVHHLDGPGKQALFADMLRALRPGGALILADLIAPQTELGVALAARAWDDEARRRSLEIDGHLKAFETFQSDGWNFYSDPEPDPIDKPSPLFDQLTWLAEAGFEAVDVHWMKAGHALYGGRKPAR
jgi:tRNA (cmo5U34)-methyltransferase